MKKILLCFALTVMMICSVFYNADSVYASGTNITVTKAKGTPYTGEERVLTNGTKVGDDKTLPEGWEWENPEQKLTTEFQDVVAIQKNSEGKEINRVTVRMRKQESVPSTPWHKLLKDWLKYILDIFTHWLT